MSNEHASPTVISDPNSYQVGGDHYKTALEHWDWVEQNRLSYLVGCATKYVARWKKKSIWPDLLVELAAKIGFKLASPRDDLEKSLHYVDKLIALHAAGVMKPMPYGLKVPAAEFAAANGLGPIETMVCELLSGWRNKRDLEQAKVCITTLLNRPDTAPVVQPVAHQSV